MINKIQEVQSIIDTSPKYKDCLLLPIGLTDGKCNDLMFSCRGKLPSNNAYIVYSDQGIHEENFLTGLLINACRKYNPNELCISYYNCSTNKDIPYFIDELPNIKSIKTLISKDTFNIEIDLLSKIFNERIEKILKFNDCFARAVRDKEHPLIGMPQEVLIFNMDRDVFEWFSREQKFNSFITQTLWRVGIYPILIVDYWFHYFPFRSHYGSEFYLYPICNRISRDLELSNNQAFMHICEDSWCWGSERKEVIDIPYYTEDWVRESIAQIRDNIKNG